MKEAKVALKIIHPVFCKVINLISFVQSAIVNPERLSYYYHMICDMWLSNNWVWIPLLQL